MYIIIYADLSEREIICVEILNLKIFNGFDEFKYKQRCNSFSQDTVMQHVEFPFTSSLRFTRFSFQPSKVIEELFNRFFSGEFKFHYFIVLTTESINIFIDL